MKMVNQEGTEVLNTELGKLQEDRAKMITDRDLKITQITNIDKKIAGIEDALVSEGDEEELAAKRAEVITLNNTVAEKNVQITNNETTIAQHESTIADKEIEIIERNAIIVEREATIDTQSNTIEDRDSTIVTLNGDITTLNGDITTLNGTITDQSSSIANLNASIVVKDDQIDMLDEIANHDLGFSTSTYIRSTDPEIPNIIDE